MDWGERVRAGRQSTNGGKKWPNHASTKRPVVYLNHLIHAPPRPTTGEQSRRQEAHRPGVTRPFAFIKACRRKPKNWVAKFTPITKISCIPKWRVSKYELNYVTTRHYSNVLCQRRLLTIHLSEHRNGRWPGFVVGRFSMTYGMPNRIVFALYKTP